MKVSGRTAAAIAASIERQLPGSPVSSPLPPVRALASRLRVSPATVASAYKLLRDRGLVAGDRRRGTRRVQAADLAETAAAEKAPGDIEIVDLSNSLPDPLLIPVPHASVIADLRPDGGPVDASLISFAAAEFEVDAIPADNLLVAAGAFDAIERILWEDLRPGDRVALEDPAAPELRDLITTAGFGPVPVAVDSEGPDPDSLNAAIRGGCRAAIVTPRAQNPTGAAITAARAEALRQVLRRASGLLLVENDYAGPIAGVGYQPLRTTAVERWAVVRSTSKFLGPDLRLALVAGDRLTIGRVRQRQALGARWPSRIIQRLVLDVWSDPGGARRLARVAEAYAHRRTALQHALAGEGFETLAQSGFNIWLPVREETAAVLGLRARGWMVAAGERFRLRSGPGLRITTSALDVAAALQFARDVAEVVPRSQVHRA